MEDSTQQSDLEIHPPQGNGSGNEKGLNQAQERDEEEEIPDQVGIGSIYPPVPNLYKRSTKSNLRRLEILQTYQLKHGEPEWSKLTPEERIQRQNQILSQQPRSDKDSQGDQEGDADDIQQPLDFDLLAETSPPNPDWIREDGYYRCFGDSWPVPNVNRPLEETGITQLYPKDQPVDRRKVMLTLLKTILATHLELTTVLLSPPDIYFRDEWREVGPPILQPDGSYRPNLQIVQVERSEAMDKVDHISNAVVNFQSLINECRPMQARENLKDVLRSQLERRRAQTKLLKSKSQEMRESIAKMRESMGMEASQ